MSSTDPMAVQGPPSDNSTPRSDGPASQPEEAREQELPICQMVVTDHEPIGQLFKLSLEMSLASKAYDAEAVYAHMRAAGLSTKPQHADLYTTKEQALMAGENATRDLYIAGFPVQRPVYRGAH